MNNNEKLIEEAAKAMFLRQNPRSSWEMIPPNDMHRVEWMTDARTAFEVFEKARTPTDDEREALIQEWANVHQGPNAHAVLLEMLPIGDQMSLALRDALRELAALRVAGGVR